MTIPSSFRDPSGFVFAHNGKVFRAVNVSYKENYDYEVEVKVEVKKLRMTNVECRISLSLALIRHS